RRLLELRIPAHVLGQRRELVESFLSLMVTLRLVGKHVLDAEASMLSSCSSEWELVRIEQPDQVLPRDIEEVSRLLSRKLLANGHDSDGVAACEHLRHPRQKMKHRLRQRDLLSGRTYKTWLH